MKNIIKAGNYILKKERGFVWACFCALLLGSAFSILPYASNEEIQLMYNGILQNIAFTNCVISLVFINVCISKLYSEKNLYSFLISGHKRAEVISGISMVVIIRTWVIMNIMLICCIFNIWLYTGKLPNGFLYGFRHGFFVLAGVELHMLLICTVFCMIIFCVRKIAAGLIFGWLFVIFNALTPVVENIEIYDISVKEMFGMYVIPNLLSKESSEFGIFLCCLTSIFLIFCTYLMAMRVFEKMEFN